MIICKLVFVALFVLSERLRAWNHGFERSINDYQLSTSISLKMILVVFKGIEPTATFDGSKIMITISGRKEILNLDA